VVTNSASIAEAALTLCTVRPTGQQRIQLRRSAGWRLPANTRVVSRPHRWANLHRVAQDQSRWWCIPDATGLLFATAEAARQQAVILYAEGFERDPELLPRAIADLRGQNLGCWCAPPAEGQPDWCHARWLIGRLHAALTCEAADG
jgi:hypothetical protein